MTWIYIANYKSSSVICGLLENVIISTRAFVYVCIRIYAGVITKKIFFIFYQHNFMENNLQLYWKNILLPSLMSDNIIT